MNLLQTVNATAPADTKRRLSRSEQDVSRSLNRVAREATALMDCCEFILFDAV